MQSRNCSVVNPPPPPPPSATVAHATFATAAAAPRLPALRSPQSHGLRSLTLCSASTLRRSPMATGAPSFESIVETYLPEIVRQHLHARPFVGAHVEDLSGVAMFADMTGFTKVTEMLAGYPNGAELISATVNDFFRALLRHVHAGGGDVVSFAGDAVLVVWACTPTEGWRTVLMKVCLPGPLKCLRKCSWPARRLPVPLVIPSGRSGGCRSRAPGEPDFRTAGGGSHAGMCWNGRTP